MRPAFSDDVYAALDREATRLKLSKRHRNTLIKAALFAMEGKSLQKAKNKAQTKATLEHISLLSRYAAILLKSSDETPSPTMDSNATGSEPSSASSEASRKRPTTTIDAPSADNGRFESVSSKRLRTDSSGPISNSFARLIGDASGSLHSEKSDDAVAAEHAVREPVIGKGNHEVRKVQYAVKNTSSRDGHLEAAIMQDLHHKNIVRLVEERRKGHRLDLVLELMDCGDLKEFVKSTELDEDHTAYIAREILSGLSYMHGKGYVHCDLKTNNVLVRSDGAIKIGDFDRTTELGLLIVTNGTKGFMAPEAIRRHAGDDVACGTALDIFSLGCLLVDLQRSVRGGIQKHVSLGYAAAYPDNGVSTLFGVVDGCSPMLRTFLRRCLVVDPATRPSADELLADPFLQKAVIGAKKFGATAKLYCTERKSARIQKELQEDRENFLATHLSLL